MPALIGLAGLFGYLWFLNPVFFLMAIGLVVMIFLHELYHSRQYTYFGDAFVPLWLLGGVYGLISSAAAGSFDWSCFQAGNANSGYGNPLEDGAQDVATGDGCV